ncbi:uncharacterized protein C8Q71DRAFT_852879 [Rhodofomes roseus]|uniref:DNA breaking-rejoining enzyme n=1 Tax=Rhodofomes roseus TaxID=34475 RepID=A0ABQ8KTL7_9APHY|nr:uncharacterized protein C8Q71DRAFT_852879 [Rhodofomes roseus]KAH9842309.1 hypothetical protein C8Q71DRAFT_852879 [Rhodofomes roseus]
MPPQCLIPDRALSILAETQSSVPTQEIEDDHEAEVESLVSGIDLDDRMEQSASTGTHYLREASSVFKKQKLDQTVMSDNLKKASANVVVDNTLNEYRRLWDQFKSFCAELGFVDDAQVMDKYAQDIPEGLPSWIAVWIMNKADDLDIHTGKPKDPSVPRVKYATAQKMRAAISHKFGRDFGFGEQPWSQNAATGTFSGNPSLSVVVSQYMISLQRRKVRAGEELWEFNIKYSTDRRRTTSRKRKAEHPEDWAGYRVRQMLQLLYIVSMLCLLRFDEALRIMWTDITMFVNDDGIHCVRLDLPFRKTAQYGGIAPFPLYPNQEQPWLCPVRAFAKWWQLCGEMNIERTGYIFRKRVGRDGSNDNFVQCFRNNLVDILIDPRPYGTHSFRRGGWCQYLAMVKRWPIRDICTWGGWAENFDNPSTIFKYLMSWVDTPLLERKDYFNPKRATADTCHQCGRTCTCA